MAIVRAMPVLAATCVLLGCGRANDAAVETKPGADASAVIVHEHDVPAEAVESARGLIERYYGLQVTVKRARRARTLKSSPGSYTIGLSADSSGSATNAVAVDGRVAIIATGDLGQDSDIIAKETMRAFGLLIGLDNCPNPRCCMYAGTSMKELSDKGMNQCPPCHIKSLELVGSTGLSETPGRRKRPGIKR